MRLTVKELTTEIRTGLQPREGLQFDLRGTHFVVQAKDIDEDNDHVLIADHLERVVPTRDFSPYAVHNRDVLFLARGRRRYATLVEGLPGAPAIALYYFFILRVRLELVHPEFLVWAINEEEAQDYLDRFVSTTGMPFVSKQSFLGLTIRVPPLAKQAQIVRLHRLARRERWLLRRLESVRSDLARSACRALHQEEDKP